MARREPSFGVWLVRTDVGDAMSHVSIRITGLIEQLGLGPSLGLNLRFSGFFVVVDRPDRPRNCLDL